MNTMTDKEYDDLSLPLDKFNPVKLNTDQWAMTAKSMGAKYVVLVAKHVGGFCLWPTSTTDYSVGHTPWRDGKGDIVGDMARSCRHYGLKLGVYLSPNDNKHGIGIGGKAPDPEKQKAYNSLYRTQLTELLTHYGKMTEVWFDGSQTVPTADLLQRYAPDAMVFQGPQATIRWVGNEDGFAPYPAWNSLSKVDARTGVATAIHGDPDGDAWMPIEVDVSLHRPNWFWHPQDKPMSMDDLLSVYYRSIGRGANLLVNLSPDSNGEIEPQDVERAKEFGDEIRSRFGKPLASTHGSTIEFPKPTLIDHVEVMEDTRGGERVRKHAIQVRVGGVWKIVSDGTAIGERRLVPIPPEDVGAVRLQVSESSGAPMIRRLAVYDTGKAPPADWNESSSLWADDQVGNWSSSGALEVSLDGKLPAAAQYRLRFVSTDQSPAEIGDLQLLLNGVPNETLVRRDGSSYVLTITGLNAKVTVRATVAGSGRGLVLLRRL